MRRRHLSIRARTTVAQRLHVDYQERAAIFRTNCRDKITAPSHITNMDEIPLTFDIPLTHKVEKKGPARWRYAQRGMRSRRSPWFLAATETDRALDDDILVNFYRCTIESILTSCVTVWYGNCSASDRKALQKVVKTAQRIAGASLPSIEDIYRRRCHRRAKKVTKDSRQQIQQIQQDHV
ncbi:hypothetical protein D4764_0122230 [Takifugu flavidus]|uniref:Alkylated DNA repair protein AlkB homologue 8 N-terminal domain-containing protein n=1 Tax=Takifugu flavidus TaxID=433684 RepID=A0A5C6MHN6_9TELE|nr:hypothetical protein D4764_0122230 [Takifugu flavidus]